MPTDPELHITVVALTGGRKYELTDEIALVKAALLYADRVTLASPKVILLASVASYLAGSPAERRAALMEMGGLLPDAADVVLVWRELLKKKHKTAREIIELHRMEKALDETSPKMAAKIEAILQQAKADELERALQTGVLDLDPLGADRLDDWYGDQGLVHEMAQLIERLLGQSAQTYPMFSESTGGLARAMVKEGKIAGAELGPATQAGIAGRFIAAIDAFPDAPMDVVLDARSKLRGPLRRFRAGVTRLSRQLDESGVTALDPGFERASADLYREHVAPALQEIEELSREMGLRNALLRTSPTVGRDVALATLALAVTTGGGIEDLAKLAAGAAGDLLGRAALKQRALRDKRDRNEFVFLFEAEKRLS